MRPIRLVASSIASLTAIVMTLAASPSPASAATAAEKLSVMSSWSQPTTASYNGWSSARLNQGGWSSYAFDWSTDYCSASPDQPAGFDFRLSCWRHDFGYRNYKAMGQFPANKARIDDSFYFDLKAKCATYSSVVRPACNSLAWTYYSAVHLFGNLAVPAAEIQRAAQQKAAAEAEARAAAKSQ